MPDVSGIVDVAPAIVAYVLAENAAFRSEAPVARVAIVPAWGNGGLWAIDHVPTGKRLAVFGSHADATRVAKRLSPSVFGRELSFPDDVREDLAIACILAGLDDRPYHGNGRRKGAGIWFGESAIAA